MMLHRVIPTLLLKNNGLVKTTKFKNPKYVGDPINAVKIFNDKEVDELLFLDITATAEGTDPDYELIQDIASEAFIPFGYGGGISNLQQIEKLFRIGVEKVVINSAFYSNPQLVKEASQVFGSQSIVVSLDIKKTFFRNHELCYKNAKISSKITPRDAVKMAEDLGAGELIINSVDRDGTGEGYDIDLIQALTKNTTLPLIASGGAGKLEDFSKAIAEGGAAAVAAGSFFVFHGKHRAVLITYPTREELDKVFHAHATPV